MTILFAVLVLIAAVIASLLISTSRKTSSRVSIDAFTAAPKAETGHDQEDERIGIGVIEASQQVSLRQRESAAAATPARRASRSRITNLVEVPCVFAVVDVETTGFSPGMDEIIEIGALKCAGLENGVSEFSTLVRPRIPVPPGITATTGITQEMVNRSGVDLKEGIAKLQAFLSDIPVIGYNVSFDVRFLKCASDQHKLVFENRYLDVKDMARDAYPHLPSHKLEDIARMLNLSDENAHRALADCRRTLAVFQHVVSKVDGRTYTWNDPRDLPVIEPNLPRPLKYEQFLNHAGTHYPAQQGNQDGHLRGERVVFTGDLSIPRSKAIELAVDAGCDVNPNVNRKTTIVVSGFRDPSLYNKAKSGKLLKAEELIEEGYPLRIMTEGEFFKLLGKANLN